MAADVTMLERGGTEEGRKEMDKGYSHSDPPIQLLQPFPSTSYYFQGIR